MPLKNLSKTNLFLVWIVIFFYFWILTSGNFLLFESNKFSFYNCLAESFLDGRLDLKIKPDDNLLMLSNPYDPRANYNYKLHDGSLYNGKYYTYFGITPVIIFYLPYKILLHKYLSDKIVTFIFCVGIFLVSVQILLFFYKHLNIKNQIYLALPILLLGFCNLTSFLMRRGMFYEVVIASGAFFMLLAIKYFIQAFLFKEVNLNHIALGSVCLGFSFWSRNYLLFSCLLMIYFVYREIKFKASNLQVVIKLFLPFLIFVCLQGFYNYARFENFFENGHNYILSSVYFDKGWYTTKNFIYNLYLYLFYDFDFTSKLPFFALKSPIVENLPIRPKHLDGGNVCGVFSIVPLLYLFIFYIFKILNANKFDLKLIYNKFSIIYFPGSLIFISAIGNFVPLLFFIPNQLRYRVDFMPLWILLTSIMWLLICLDKKFANLSKMYILFSSLSLFMCFLFSFTSAEDTFLEQNIKQYLFLGNYLNWLQIPAYLIFKFISIITSIILYLFIFINKLFI